MRGFFEIGVFHGKNVANLGTLMRSAFQLGAAGVFTIGRRYTPQASDTLKTWRHVPVRNFETFDEYVAALPHDCQIVAIEMDGKSLATYSHPDRASYLLGAEDHGIPPEILKKCHRHVSLISVNKPSFNVAVAGSIVMYDRVSRRQ